MAEETPNPASDARPGDPCVMVIFGATGDLTKRKLLPTLYNLAKKNLVAKDFALIGFAIEPLNDDQFRDQVRKDLVEFAGAPADCEFCNWLLERLYYVSGVLKVAAAYGRLKSVFAEAEQKQVTKTNSLYYLVKAPA